MKAEIKTNGTYTQIFLDGIEVHRVVSYELSESVTDRPILKLELAVEEVETDLDITDVKFKTLKDKRNEEGWKDFVKFLFGNSNS